MKKILKAAGKEDGQALVMMALFLVVISALAAFVVDIGSAVLVKSSLQDFADAAALAGADDLPDSDLAKSTAVYYAEANSGGSVVTETVSPYNGDAAKILVRCSSPVAYKFAGIFGASSAEVTAFAVAQKTSGLGTAFGYTVFSGSESDTLVFNGSSLYIGGNAHANAKFTINGSSQTITGSAEAVSKFTINGSNITVGGTCRGSTVTTNGSSINIGSRVTSAADVIDMPDFSDEIRSAAAEAGQAYSGNKIYNGSRVSVDSPIYVNGNLTVNGSDFEGRGIVLVKGDITFNGSNLKYTSDSSVCFYSENGDITINGSGIALDGIVYAPNGSIIMNGSSQQINGRVIGEELTFNGSDIRITSSSGDLDCLPSASVKLIA